MATPEEERNAVLIDILIDVCHYKYQKMQERIPSLPLCPTMNLTDPSPGRGFPAPGSVFGDSLERYMQILDPVDADWLGQITQTSWEPVVAQLEALNRANRDSSITRRLLSRVRCFTDSLRPFFGTVDVTVGSSAGISGVVWGALKLVIEASHRILVFSNAHIRSRLHTSSLNTLQLSVTPSK
jgi:hypothetical protein